MGCDIHIYAEAKLPDGTWHMVHTFSATSPKAFKNADKPDVNYFWYRIGAIDYTFFSALAGVRGPGPEPRGLPKDVSPMVDHFARSWGSDGHSHSWLDAEAFAKLVVQHKLSSAEVAEWVETRMKNTDPYWGLPRILEQYVGLDIDDYEELKNVRFVFWFDN